MRRKLKLDSQISAIAYENVISRVIIRNKIDFGSLTPPKRVEKLHCLTRPTYLRVLALV